MMLAINLVGIFLLMLCGPTVVNTQTHVIVFPNVVRPASDVVVHIRFLVPVISQKVKVKLLGPEDIVYGSGSLTISSGAQVGTVRFPTPGDLKVGRYKMKVKAKGTVHFERTSDIVYLPITATLYIQTDKRFYTPGDTVKYRIFAIDGNLKMVNIPVEIQIKDPNGTRIVYTDTMLDTLGLSDTLELPTKPILGQWQIVATIKNHHSTNVKFYVEEEDRPPFDVTLTVPDTVSLEHPNFTGTISARYPYGKPVQGKAVIQLYTKNSYTKPSDAVSAVELDLELNGATDFSVPMSMVRILDFEFAHGLYLNATVTDKKTFEKSSDRALIWCTQKGYTVRFDAVQDNRFYPGVPVTLKVHVSRADSQPFSDIGGTLRLKTSYAKRRPDTSDSGQQLPPYSPVYPIIRLVAGDPDQWDLTIAPDIYYPIPRDGIVTFTLDIPVDVIKVSLEAVYMGERGYYVIDSFYSPSNTYLMLSLLSQSVKVGQMASFELRSNVDLREPITYHIMSKRQLLETNIFNVNGKEETIFVEVTSAMAPEACLVVHYVSSTGEIIAASVNFKVDDIFENKVSMEFARDRVNPDSEVTLRVRADPGSVVNLLVVDKSALLTRQDHQITVDKLRRTLAGFNHVVYPGEIMDVYSDPRYKGIVDLAPAGTVFDFPETMMKHHGIKVRPNLWGDCDPQNSEDIFSFAHLVVLTDADFKRRSWNKNRSRTSRVAERRKVKLDTEKYERRMLMEGVDRKRFPVTWIWTRAEVGSDGYVDVTELVPDRITDWVATAFVLNDRTGFGMAPAANLSSFSYFYIHLEPLATVYPTEIVQVTAKVLNLYYHAMNVTVTLSSKSRDLQVEDGLGSDSVDKTAVKCIWVEAQSEGLVSFWVQSARAGLIPFTVTATSSQDSDTVEGHLRVKVRGQPRESNQPLFVSLTPDDDVDDDGDDDVDDDDDGDKDDEKDDARRSKSKTIVINRPQHVLHDDDNVRIVIKVTGDIFAPSMAGLANLVHVPKGCGEQNMVTFAPIVSASRYLKHTNRLTPEQKDRVEKSLRVGYQQQLDYKRSDGSFSAFGPKDESGSLWLTSYVLKSFSEAREFVYISLDVIESALRYVLRHQQNDGSFVNTGRVHIKPFMGTSAATIRSLTAFVMVSLLEVEKANIIENANLTANLTSAIQHATHYLIGAVEKMTEDYELAISGYALARVRSAAAVAALTQLSGRDNAIREDGKLHWQDNVTSHMVEVASYALMTCTTLKLHDCSMSILQWLLEQRNAYGGFHSTQDTSVAIQAVSEAAERMIPENIRMNITVSDRNSTKSIQLNNANYDVIQFFEISNNATAIDVKVTGTGRALVEVSMFYNIVLESEESFNLTVDSESPPFVGDFRLKVCMRWDGPGLSGMVLVDVGLLSGRVPMMEHVRDTGNSKRRELEDGHLFFYFDEVNQTEVCMDIEFKQKSFIHNLSMGAVRVFSYYDKNKNSMTGYSPDVLDFPLCRNCPEQCNCPRFVQNEQGPCVTPPTLRPVPGTWIPESWKLPALSQRLMQLRIDTNLPDSRSWGQLMWRGGPHFEGH